MPSDLNRSISSQTTAEGKVQTSPSAKRRPTPRSPGEVQEWLVSYLAEALQVASDSIDVEASFDTFGLDSVTAIGMTGHLEEWLGCQVDPMSVYDYPTIEKLAGYLSDQTGS
jgi:acyl carrier protein